MRKIVNAQFVLQGTEADINRIEKEIAEISVHEEIIAFNLNERVGNMTEIFSEFLSNCSEIHSFVIGIYSGLTEWKGIDSKLMENPDVMEEPHYCYGGYFFGTVLRWAMIISFAHFGLNVAWT